VSPASRTEEIVGWQNDTLRVRVKAPPERGKATDAVLGLIASKLGLPAAQVTLKRGGGSRDKLLLIDGLTDSQVRTRLGR
jgi:uncharacterized protein (TIGR00251 family)